MAPPMTTELVLRRFATAPAGFSAAVTTRHGGVSEGAFARLNLADHVGDDPVAVRENRRLVCAAFDTDALTIADQQHGANVAVIDEGLAGAGHADLEDAQRRLPATDALVTSVSGATLGILVGDCVPVVLWDATNRALGVAHCGRGGVVTGVLPATMGTMASAFGTSPRDLWVGLGPHIGPASYEVGPAEVEATEAAVPGAGVVRPTAGGRGCVDLAAAIRTQLVMAGVEERQIEIWPGDTRTSTDEFFSDRAQRPCGRFALLAKCD